MAPRFARVIEVDAPPPLSVEHRGLEPVPTDERHGSLWNMLWTWFAANIGIITVTVGSGLVTGLQLNAWQAVVAAVVGSLGAFAFVALLSLAGPWSGAPTLMASRATFGVRGNLVPAAISWIGLVGLEVVMATTATFAIASIVELMGWPIGPWLTIPVAVLLVAGATVIGYYGHSLIMVVQKWLGWVLAPVMLVLCVVALTTVDWKLVASVPPADFGSLMAGIGVVAAGTGVSWMSTGADYSRYLPSVVSKRRLFASVLGGSSVPLVLLVSSGAFLALGNSAAAGLALPDWLLVPYLIASVLGLLAAADLALYSSGLSLQATGVPLPRPIAFLVSAGLVLVAVVAVVATQTVAGDLTFAEAVPALMAVFSPLLVAWVGVFGLDLILRRDLFDGDLTDTSHDSEFWFSEGFHWPAVAAWLAGSALGLMCVRLTVGETVWFAGPLADTWLGHNSLGWLVAGIWASAVYWVLEPLTRRQLPGRAHVEDSED
ncbi:MAG: cytosine permease [Propionibacteriales bacterium]|nr:cytosine permease [Propionibacteriales bacterium]